MEALKRVHASLMHLQAASLLLPRAASICYLCQILPPMEHA